MVKVKITVLNAKNCLGKKYESLLGLDVCLMLYDEQIVTTTDIVKISSLGSDSQMRKICDQILMRMKDE